MLCRRFQIKLSLCCHTSLTTWNFSFTESICRALYGVNNRILDWMGLTYDHYYFMSSVFMLYIKNSPPLHTQAGTDCLTNQKLTKVDVIE